MNCTRGLGALMMGKWTADMRGEGTRGEEWKEGSMKIDEYDEEGTWGW
jgi:hypothetical protein